MATNYDELAAQLEAALPNFRKGLSAVGRGPKVSGMVAGPPPPLTLTPASPGQAFPAGAFARPTPPSPLPGTGMPSTGFNPMQQVMARGTPAAANPGLLSNALKMGNMGWKARGGLGIGGQAVSMAGESAAKQLGRESLPGEITSFLSSAGGNALTAYALSGGNPFAAAVGGIYGGGKSLLDTFTKDYAEPKTKLDWDMFEGQLDPEIIETGKLMHNVIKQSSDKKTADTQVNEWLLNQIQTGLATKVDEKKALAQQQMISDFIQPYIGDMMQSARTRYQQTVDMASSLPPGYREIALNQASQELNSSTRVGAAYGTQAQLYPGQLAQQKTQSQYDQLAQQAWQAAASGGGGSTSSLDEELAALAGG
jgi:hypothetical protein